MNKPLKHHMLIVAWFFGLCSVCLVCSVESHAQEQEAKQLMLDIQKLAQLKKVLQTMYQGYKILTVGYNRVKAVTSGSYSLHEAFLDGLLTVSPAVSKYERIADIIKDEGDILSEYRNAYSQFRQSGLFRPEELSYMAGIYSNLIHQSAQNISELTMVITSGDLRMSDDERLQAIDGLFEEAEQELAFLKAFNHKAATLASERAQQKNETVKLQQVYGTDQ